MKTNFLLSASLLLLCGLSPRPAHSESGPREWMAGLNYSGLGVRHFFNDAWALELRGQALDGVALGGLRGYFYFQPRVGVFPYVGIEGDYFSFEGDISEGTGLAAQGFVGGEYFFSNRLAFQMDLGAAWMQLKDSGDQVTEDSLEYVLNIGVNLYFGKKAKG